MDMIFNYIQLIPRYGTIGFDPYPSHLHGFLSCYHRDLSRIDALGLCKIHGPTRTRSEYYWQTLIHQFQGLHCPKSLGSSHISSISPVEYHNFHQFSHTPRSSLRTTAFPLRTPRGGLPPHVGSTTRCMAASRRTRWAARRKRWCPTRYEKSLEHMGRSLWMKVIVMGKKHV